MTTYRPIEVLLADDHEIFRDGFGLITKFSVTAQEEECLWNQSKEQPNTFDIPL